MSEATRAVALAEAGKLNLKTAEATLAAATAYDAFLTSTAAAKPAAKPTGKKPGKTEEEVVKDALEAQAAAAAAEEGNETEGGEEADDGLPASADGVQAGIARLLKANKRKEAIGLLKKFGAASASGVKAKDYAKFVAEVTKVLAPADAESDDLTA